MNAKLKWMAVMCLSFGMIYPTITEATLYCVVARTSWGKGVVKPVPVMTWPIYIPAHEGCMADASTGFAYSSKCYDGGSGSTDQDNRDSTARYWIDQGWGITRCSSSSKNYSDNSLTSVQRAAKDNQNGIATTNGTHACDNVTVTGGCENWITSWSARKGGTCSFPVY